MWVLFYVHVYWNVLCTLVQNLDQVRWGAFKIPKTPLKKSIWKNEQEKIIANKWTAAGKNVYAEKNKKK